MLRLERREAEPFVRVAAAGSLTGTDYDEVLPEIERLIDKTGPLRLLVVLDDFQGWTPEMLWREVRLGEAHQGDVERIAFIGDRSWQGWLTELAAPFDGAEARFYDRAQVGEAEEWLKN